MYVCMGTVQRIHGPQDEIKRIRKSVEMNTMDKHRVSSVCVAETVFNACIRE